MQLVQHIQKHGTCTGPAQLWDLLRDVVGDDLPEPSVLPAGLDGGLDESLLWDTEGYTVRIEVPDKLDKLVIWEARGKRSGTRSSGRGNPVSCPALALWLGRLCGEHAALRGDR